MTMSAPDLLKDAEPQTFDERLALIDKKLIWTDDGISVVCGFDDEEWSYFIVKGGAAITPKVTSKKPPYEVDPHNRDSKLKKSLSRVENKTGINTDAAMDVLGDFGLYLMNSPEAIDSYMKSIPDSPSAEASPVNEELVAQAQDILKNGDPIKYIMDTFHTCHISDDDYGRLLLCAIGSQHVRNTHGVHLTPSGASGKGKSHAGKTMLHLVPSEWWMETSLSPKSLYYNNITPGTIIFSDDVTLDEELLSIIRRCITGFTKPQEHRTVDGDRHGITLTIPERIIWIIASVENFMDEQTRNRMMDIPVDESDESDEMVYEKQVDNAKTGADEFPETNEVLLCREIFRIIKNLDPTPIVIPFADDIPWKNKNNRRNFDMFLELIKAHTVIRHLQRDKTDDGALIAASDDYHDAAILYKGRKEAEETKLTDPERQIIRALEDYGDLTEQDLVRILKVPTTTLHYRLHGRKDRGSYGLLAREESLITCTRESRDVSDGVKRSVNVYSVVNKRGLNLYPEAENVRSSNSNNEMIELAQQDRMNAIDQFFREHRDNNGELAEITHASDQDLADFTPKIAEQLHISRDVAFKSAMEYGRNRGWV